MNNLLPSPSTGEELREEIAEIAGNVGRLAVLGTGSRFPLPDEIYKIKTGKISGINFFFPEDMVVGVKAGTSFSELRQVLSEKRMRLPINPRSDSGTVGAVVACNDGGASRLFAGGLRDYLIGVEYVNGKGKIVKAGGRVVKNVAGYDLMKLILGSQGGLGAVLGINFKVLPKRKSAKES